MTTSWPFRLRIMVRGYELDSLGHVNHAVYLQYAEHARWEAFAAAGVTQQVLLDAGVGPVILELTVRYKHELRLGDEVDVGFRVIPGEGKAIAFEHEVVRADGVLAAELSGYAGVMSFAERRLIADPVARLRELATASSVIGL